MPLTEDFPATGWTIRAIEQRRVRLGGLHEGRPADRWLERSFILTPETLIADWPVADFAALRAANLAVLLTTGADLILLGTGERQRFPPPALLVPFSRQGIGCEVMTSAAACRTYNVLAAEGRAVAAAVIMEPLKDR